MLRIPRTYLATWWHLIQTELPSGKSQVLATLCNRRSVEELAVSLQKNRETKQTFVYSVDPTPIYEPNRRCDSCLCRVKG
jgi:hypothetical protein